MMNSTAARNERELSMLQQFIDSGVCPCGGILEETESGWVCSRCGWSVLLR
jgi:hypothetical protein